MLIININGWEELIAVYGTNSFSSIKADMEGKKEDGCGGERDIPVPVKTEYDHVVW